MGNKKKEIKKVLKKELKGIKVQKKCCAKFKKKKGKCCSKCPIAVKVQQTIEKAVA